MRQTQHVCVTTSARHVVAPRSMLNGCMATWTFLDVVNLHPLLEQPVPSVFTVHTGDALVVLDVARQTDACKARWAG